MLTTGAYGERDERHMKRKFLAVSRFPKPCLGSLEEQYRFEDQQAKESLAEAIDVKDVQFESISKTLASHECSD